MLGDLHAHQGEPQRVGMSGSVRHLVAWRCVLLRLRALNAIS